MTDIRTAPADKITHIVEVCSRIQWSLDVLADQRWMRMRSNDQSPGRRNDDFTHK